MASTTFVHFTPIRPSALRVQTHLLSLASVCLLLSVTVGMSDAVFANLLLCDTPLGQPLLAATLLQFTVCT